MSRARDLLLSSAHALYRLLLRACPLEVREACGGPMSQAFRTLCAREWRRGGPGALVRVAVPEYLDLLRAGLQARGSLDGPDGGAWRQGSGGRADGDTRLPGPERGAGEGRPSRLLADLVADLRHTVRQLRERPAHAAVSLLTVAVVVGAGTATFSVLDAIVLRPLPWRDADRLVVLERMVDAEYAGPYLTVEGARAWAEQAAVFEGLAAYTGSSAVLLRGDEPEQVRRDAITPGTLEFLGARPLVGRGFQPGEGGTGAPPVALIGEGLWRSRFGGDRDVLGDTLTLDDERYTVVGVMPDGFSYPAWSTDVWVALSLEDPGDVGSVEVVARLRPGLDPTAAGERVDAVAAGLQENRPRERGWQVRLSPMARSNRDTGEALWALSAAVAFLVLIGCANLASVMLARSTVREREVAVRAALGAGRGRLVRHVLTGSLIVALLGGLAGAGLAVWLTRLLRGLAPTGITFLSSNPIDVDGRAVGFTLGVTLLTGLLVGLVPAVRGSRPDLLEALGGSTRGGGARRGQRRFRNAMVVAEVALSLVLLVGAGLMIGGFLRLASVDPGFEPGGLVSMTLELPAARYPTGRAQQAFFDRYLEGIEARPAVQSATVTGGIPPSGGGLMFGIQGQVLGGDPWTLPEGQVLAYSSVRPGYFELMGIPVLQGRGFVAADMTEEPDTIVVGETLARHVFGDADPVGRRVRWGDESPWRTVVGVAADVKQMGLDDRYGEMELYRPFALGDEAHGYFEVVVRLQDGAEAGAVLPEMRRQVWALDARLPVRSVATLEDRIWESLAEQRFYLTVMLGFAAVAGLLAAVGIYGVLAWTVSQRRHEIGVRMTLGADGTGLFGRVVRDGMLLTLAGLALGIPVAAAVTRFLGSLLFEIEPTDVPTFLATAAFLAAVALLACAVPAWRATRVDPLEALRVE